MTPAKLDDAVLVQREGDIAVWTLNRPDIRNPLTDKDILAALHSAVEAAAADLSIRCVILTGAGPAFSAGGNLKHMRDRTESFAGSASELRDHYRFGIQAVTKAVYELEVPVIAAVNGPAYGAGCDMTAACDLRIAGESAVFAENFVKVGLISGDGGSWLLPRAVGWQQATLMSLTGEPVNAAEAKRIGLVLDVVPDAELMTRARELAHRISANPPRQLRLAKRLLREAQTSSFASLLEIASAFQGACHHTKDHEEAVAAFFEKRRAVFTGH
jgi:enoyl-CoA hydratase/carnithine racemase